MDMLCRGTLGASVNPVIFVQLSQFKKLAFSAWTVALNLWHISAPLSLLARVDPTVRKPILELPLGAL